MRAGIILSIFILGLSAIAQDDSKRAKFQAPYSAEQKAAFGKSDVARPGCTGDTSSLSLYDPGQSLEGVKQQDQDGMMTCYANTASLMLKSKNPTLPVPSYLDLASHNPSTGNKTYAFNFGYSCDVINDVIQKKSSLCQDGVLENQPSSLQDTVIYKLHDVINKYNYTPEQMGKVLGSYSGFLRSTPFPEAETCRVKDVSSYLSNKLSFLASESSYENENGESSEESKQCFELMTKRMTDLGFIEWSQEYEMFISKDEPFKNDSVSYVNQLNTTTFPSGKTYTIFLQELLNSQPTEHAVYEHAIGNSAQANGYKDVIDSMLTKLNPSFISKYAKLIVADDPQMQKCWDKANKTNNENNPGLFFNTLLGQCKTKRQAWRNEIWEETKTCHDPEKDLFDVFKSLTALGKSVQDIEQYLVSKDENTLAQIINRNCTEKHFYQAPNSCKNTKLVSGLGAINSLDDWQAMRVFKADMDEFLSKNKLAVKVDMNKFSDFWQKKYFKGDEDISPEFKAYQQLMIDTLNGAKNVLVKSKDEWLTLAHQIGQGYQKTKDDMANNIVNSIKSGSAVGLGSCGSLFSDKDKQSYPGCDTHAVTATGIKCVGGRLKLEISNSWGIGCIDEADSKSMYECERDQDGITNGRSWVDFDYLADQGLETYSF